MTNIIACTSEASRANSSLKRLSLALPRRLGTHFQIGQRLTTGSGCGLAR